jgi:ABC-type dipeptide/oligopeptide/nickel transport system permease component
MCYILIQLLPDAPIIKGIGKDPNLQLSKNEQLGLNDPIIVQFYRYVVNIFRYGYWGIGLRIYPQKEVVSIIGDKMKYTVIVNLYSILFAIPLGLGFGIYAALRKNRWQDHIISTLVVVFISVPSYVYAFLVQYFLCFKLNWFPLQTYSLTDAGGLLTWRMFYSMIPAILSLGFGVVAGLTRYTRAELSEVLTSEFMLLARTKGLTKAQATTRHALKNAMVVILPMIIGEFIGIMSGSLIIEGIFGIPGIGPLYITSINSRDYNFFMALTVFYTFIGLFAGIVVDISYGFIDPRIRMGQR